MGRSKGPSKKKPDASAPSSQRTSARKKKDSTRLKEAKEHHGIVDQARKTKKQGEAKRRKERAQDQHDALMVENENESTREVEMREMLLKVTAELEETKAKLAASKPADDEEPLALIPAPTHKSKITVRSLREAIGLGEPKHKRRWRAIRGIVRSFSGGKTLQTDKTMSNQKPHRLADLYAAIEEEAPELSKLENNWGSEWLVADHFNVKRASKLADDPDHVPRPATNTKNSKGKGKDRLSVLLDRPSSQRNGSPSRQSNKDKPSSSRAATTPAQSNAAGSSEPRPRPRMRPLPKDPEDEPEVDELEDDEEGGAQESGKEKGKGKGKGKEPAKKPQKPSAKRRKPPRDSSSSSSGQTTTDEESESGAGSSSGSGDDDDSDDSGDAGSDGLD